MTTVRAAGRGPGLPRFLGLTEDDFVLLEQYREQIVPDDQSLAHELHDHLLHYPRLTTVPGKLPSQKLDDLARRLARHVRELLAGRFGAAWTEGVRELGRIQFRLGVEPLWLAGAYALCWSRWDACVEKDVPRDHRMRLREVLFRLIIADLMAQLGDHVRVAQETHDERLLVFDVLLRALSLPGVAEDPDSSRLLNEMCNGLVSCGAAAWAGYAVVDDDQALTFHCIGGETPTDLQIPFTPVDPCWTALERGESVILSVRDPRAPPWMKRLHGELAEIACLPFGHGALRALGMIGSREQGFFQRVGPAYFLAFVRLGDLVLRMRAHSQEDPLTGLPNRRFFIERLQQARIQNERRARLLGVGMLDLDGFKQVNDRIGHAAGDALLCQAVARMKLALRAGDTLARMGGDEFGLLLPDLERIDDLEAICERITEGLRRPFNVHGELVRVTCSLGFTLHPVDDGEAESLLRHADLALYAAKEQGRDQYQLHTFSLDARISDEVSARERVDLALREGRLLLHYQPIVTLGGHGVVSGVVGFEALLRLNDGCGGLLTPDQFGGALDHGRLGRAIGRFVLESALTQAEIWHRQGLPLRICVNISALHLLEPRFHADLEEALGRHPDLAARYVEIEITESAPLRDFEAAQRVLEGCVRLGVRISLDDFGTGNASLVYLQKIPAHTLKIDRCFVGDVLDDPRDLAIVSGLIMTARMLGLDVVAEGVETSRQAALLTDIQCRLLQGYFIARPMSPETVPEWFRQYQAGSGSVMPETGFPPPAPIGYAADSIFRAHTHRVHQFVAALEGKEPFPALVLDSYTETQCHLGRWLEHEGYARFGHDPAYPTLRERHSRTHSLARDARAFLDDGNDLEARRCGSLLRIENDALMAELRALLESGSV
ncbi:MAG: EAL domain-containing protein [Gammaproteobacteria bacterium]|nr:EAL domain-containing protein [Gammaproteobacteria bacterium]